MLSNKSVILLMVFTILVVAPIVVMRHYHNIFSEQNATLEVTLISKEEQKLYRLDLEEYLIGVVAAEMPAKFELEALKAQAVAARTVAIRRMKRFGGRGTRYYQEADFSDDPNESQAWLGPKRLQSKWGYWDYRTYYYKIQRAVRETRGVIMVFQGKPIDAVFHSTCGVGTESAENVWNYKISYLQHVDCGMDQQSPRYREVLFFTWKDLGGLLQIPEMSVRDLKIIKWTSGRRVSLLSCGGRTITGKFFRQQLGLNSNAFQIRKTASGIRLTVIGYGHGVGMCQYGANGFAKRGWDYRQILAHYYRGIDFWKIKY